MDAIRNKISMRQLGTKNYNIIENLSDEIVTCFGRLEDAFDMIIYGASGNGKTNLTVKLMIDICKAIKGRVEYVSYEEGHNKTMQELMITRHRVNDELGNKVMLAQHYTYDELVKEMDKRRSAKIWIIDSLQASRLTAIECATLKNKFVLSRRRKIIIYTSWAEGKKPAGSSGKSVEYYANIKVRVEGFIAFVTSRYGGNKNYCIWEEGAQKYWGKKLLHKHLAR